MKIDRYKIDSSLSELQVEVGELTRQTRDALQKLLTKSAVVVEQTKTIPLLSTMEQFNLECRTFIGKQNNLQLKYIARCLRM